VFVPGNYAASSCEYLLLGKRGNISRVNTPQARTLRQVIKHTRGHFAEKPAIIRDQIKLLFGVAKVYVGLFSRHSVEGWIMYGDEAGKYN